MLNLLKFKKAVYAEGRQTNQGGAQAYGLYVDAVAKLLIKYGVIPLFDGRVERLSCQIAIKLLRDRQCKNDISNVPAKLDLN